MRILKTGRKFNNYNAIISNDNDSELQKKHDEFIENSLTNFYMPLGVAPNFLINGEPYTIPMVIEESSVVAAASKAAKFWLNSGGFKAEVLDTLKVGQVHFLFNGDPKIIHSFFEKNKPFPGTPEWPPR